ncbi:hypothetical protein DXG01_015498 [Tephrocybe rancida]|nr:hypothetical protein DXG01_015498 [Tephrocybe rancida]
MFMSSLPDVTLDLIWLRRLADQNGLTEAIEGVLGVADHSFMDTSSVFKSCNGDIEMSTNPPVGASKRKANASFEPGNAVALAFVKEVGTTLEHTGTVMVEELTTYSNILATTAVHQVFKLDLAHQIYKHVLQRCEAVLQELAVCSMENTSIQLSHLNVASGSQVPAAADKDMNPNLSGSTGDEFLLVLSQNFSDLLIFTDMFFSIDMQSK